MKCICFGSLFVLMYQARGQGIKSAPLCSAIFAPFGVNLAYRDTSLPGHLKNGHDKVPSDIADVVRECDPEAAVRSFERTVMPLIKDSMRAPLLQAVLAVLDEDKTIDTNSPVSWLRGYTKGAVLSASSIDLTYLLTSLVRFAILETDNNECADGIREIPDKFVSGFPKSAAPIELDEPGIIIKWPDGELNTAATRKYISDDEIRNDVDVLKKMLSKYKSLICCLCRLSYHRVLSCRFGDVSAGVHCSPGFFGVRRPAKERERTLNESQKEQCSTDPYQRIP